MLAPSLSIRWTSRTRISSLMRGPSLRAGSGALIGRRMARNSSAVATIRRERSAAQVRPASRAGELKDRDKPARKSTPNGVSGAGLRQMVANRSTAAGPGHFGIKRRASHARCSPHRNGRRPRRGRAPRSPARAASLNENKRMRAAASAASSPAGTRRPVMRSSATAGGASTTSGPAARSDTTTGRAMRLRLEDRALQALRAGRRPKPRRSRPHRPPACRRPRRRAAPRPLVPVALTRSHNSPV